MQPKICYLISALPVIAYEAFTPLLSAKNQFKKKKLRNTNKFHLISDETSGKSFEILKPTSLQYDNGVISKTCR